MGSWFGESWGAPVCEPETHIDTPVGESCDGWCGEDFIEGDQGHAIPAYGSGRLSVVYYHHNCFLRTIFGSVGHQNRTCHCYGGEGAGDPPGRTPRQAADDAVIKALGRFDGPLPPPDPDCGPTRKAHDA